MSDMPAAKMIASDITANNGTACAATPAEIASSPISVAVSKPSPKSASQRVHLPAGCRCCESRPTSTGWISPALSRRALEPFPVVMPRFIAPKTMRRMSTQHEQIQYADRP